MKCIIFIVLFVISDTLLAQELKKCNILISGKLQNSDTQKIYITQVTHDLKELPIYIEKDFAKTEVDSIGNFAFKFFINRLSMVKLNGNHLFISPGDSITLIIKEGKIEQVRGVNQNNYLLSNLYDSLVYKRKHRFLDPEQHNSISKNISFYQLLYSNREQTLGRYVRDYKISKEILDFLLAELKYAKYNDIGNLLLSTKISKEQKQVIVEALPTISNLELIDTANLHSIEFVSAARFFLHTQMNNFEWGTSNYLIENKRLIDSLLQGEVKSFFELNLFKSYVLQRNMNHAYAIDSIYKVLKISLTKKDHLEALERWNTDYNWTKIAISSDFLNDSLINQNREKITFKDLITKYGDKTIYIDFWASWCAPCIAEMPYSKKLQQSDDFKDMIFLYFSMDGLPKDWQKGIIKTGIKENHYLLLKGIKSKMAEMFRLFTIPKYVLIRNGKLISIDAPRPSNPEFIKNILNE